MFDSITNGMTTMIIVIIVSVATIIYKLDKLEDAIRANKKDE